MTDIQVQLAVLLMGQVITILTLFLTSYLARRQAAYLLRDEIQTRKRIEHLERQLIEFYGPIAALLSMNKAILQLSYDPNTNSYTGAVPRELWHDLRDNIVIPNNLKIVEIIKEHFHLIEGIRIPVHVVSFIVHAEVWPLSGKYGLEKEKYLARFRFPPEFEEYIHTTTDALKSEYYSLVSAEKVDSV